MIENSKKERDLKILIFVIIGISLSVTHNTIGWGSTGFESVLTYAAIVVVTVAAVGLARSIYR